MSGERAHPEAAGALRLALDWLSRAASAEAMAWLTERLARICDGDKETLAQAIGLAPRRLGRAALALRPDDLAAAHRLRAGFDPAGLTVDQLARIAILLAAYRGDADVFAEQLRLLARTAELNEMIAYCRGLAIFPAPERLRFLAAEGVRSSITTVFEAVAHRNPYPHDYFDEAAWNQMAVKALFVGSSLAPIQGLLERANPELVLILLDYARERQAARRAVDAEVWRLLGDLAVRHRLPGLVEPFETGSIVQRLAAARALHGYLAERRDGDEASPG